MRYRCDWSTFAQRSNLSSVRRDGKAPRAKADSAKEAPDCISQPLPSPSHRDVLLSAGWKLLYNLSGTKMTAARIFTARNPTTRLVQAADAVSEGVFLSDVMPHKICKKRNIPNPSLWLRRIGQGLARTCWVPVKPMERTARGIHSVMPWNRIVWRASLPLADVSVPKSPLHNDRAIRTSSVIGRWMVNADVVRSRILLLFVVCAAAATGGGPMRGKGQSRTRCHLGGAARCPAACFHRRPRTDEFCVLVS